MENEEIDRIHEIINKTCMYNKLKEDIEYKTLLSKYNKREQKVINLVEERGISGFRYQKIINQCVDYINKYLASNQSNEQGTGNLKLNGKNINVNVEAYNISIPPKLFNWVDIFNGLNISVKVYNIVKDLNREDEMKFYPHGEGAYALNNNLDYNSEDKKLYNVVIKIHCYALNGKLNIHSFSEVFYHEFNHAYENYKRLLNSNGTSSIMNLNSRKRYNAAISYLNSNDLPAKAIGEILYRLWDDSELTATSGAIFGELKAMNSKRQNYVKDMENTHAYKHYLELKEAIEVLNKNDDEIIWYNVASIMDYFKINMDIKNFKDSFIKRSRLLLDKYFRQMGKAASLYYDETEGIELNSNKKEYMY